MKKISSLLLLLLLCCVSWGCQREKAAETAVPTETETESEKKQIAIGAAMASESALYLQELSRYMEEAAEEKNAVLTMEYADWDVETQIGQMRKFIAQKVDAIILCPVNAKSLLIPLKEAKEAGIPVINLNMKVDSMSSEYIATYVGASSSEEGALAADVFIEKLGEKGGKIAIVEGAPGSDPQIYRTQTFMEQLASSPQIEVVGIYTGDWSKESAKLIAYDMLKKHTDLDGVYCQDSNIAMGVAEMAREQNRIEDLMIVGIGDEEDHLKAIAGGDIEALVSQPAIFEGKNAIYCSVMAALGEDLRPWYKDPIEVVDAGNVQSYRETREY